MEKLKNHIALFSCALIFLTGCGGGSSDAGVGSEFAGTYSGEFEITDNIGSPLKIERYQFTVNPDGTIEGFSPSGWNCERGSKRQIAIWQNDAAAYGFKGLCNIAGNLCTVTEVSAIAFSGSYAYAKNEYSVQCSDSEAFVLYIEGMAVR